MYYLVPVFIIGVFIYGAIKKVDVYSSFSSGIKDGLKTVFNIIPALVAITVLLELFNASGLKSTFCSMLSPAFKLVGIPEELFDLVFLRPFSGSASTAIFSELITKYGADSYVVRSAGVIMGSSETIFYVTAVYFSGQNIKKLGAVIPISLICATLSAIGACALCRII